MSERHDPCGSDIACGSSPEVEPDVIRVVSQSPAIAALRLEADIEYSSGERALSQAIVRREPWHEGAIWGFAQLPTAESGPNSRIS